MSWAWQRLKASDDAIVYDRGLSDWMLELGVNGAGLDMRLLSARGEARCAAHGRLTCLACCWPDGPASLSGHTPTPHECTRHRAQERCYCLACEMARLPIG